MSESLFPALRETAQEARARGWRHVQLSAETVLALLTVADDAQALIAAMDAAIEEPNVALHRVESVMYLRSSLHTLERHEHAVTR